MKCQNCGGLVLWDIPIKPDGDNSTTCQKCGGKNCQEIIIENKEIEDSK